MQIYNFFVLYQIKTCLFILYYDFFVLLILQKKRGYIFKQRHNLSYLDTDVIIFQWLQLLEVLFLQLLQAKHHHR